MSTKPMRDHGAQAGGGGAIMNESEELSAPSILLGRYAWALAVVWAAVVVASFVWNEAQVIRSTLEAARIQARVAYEKDVIYRRWNAGSGGVYVPVTEAAKPNPYLSDMPERDIRTPSGKPLTLMNPAYMTRVVHKLAEDEYGVRGHITSLNPIRPENAPDPWETEALQAFERGETEISSVEEMEDEEWMRLMRPLITEKGCLKCHAAQGYQEGDIRGGISVSIPMEPLWAVARKQMLPLAGGHLLLWLLGLGGLVWWTRRLRQSERERMRAEQALRLSAEVMDNMAEGVYLIRVKDGTIVYANPRLEQMFGYGHGEMTGKPVSIVNAPEGKAPEEVAAEIMGSLRETGTWSGEIRNIRKDGTAFWCYANVSTFDHPEHGSVWVSVHADITDRKRTEQKLHQAERLASIGTLAAGIAHEINNPLGLILMSAQRAIERNDLPKTVETTLHRIKDDVKRCARIVKSVLQFSRDETTEKWQVDVNKMIRRSEEFTREYAKHHGVRLDVECASDLPTVVANATELEQAIVNLIHNAVEAASAGQSVTLRTERAPAGVQITIADQGRGMTAEEQEHAFDPFHTTRQQMGGTGLGLSIVHGIINGQGGTIEIDSQPGKGTRVIVELPVEVPENSRE